MKTKPNEMADKPEAEKTAKTESKSFKHTKSGRKYGKSGQSRRTENDPAFYFKFPGLAKNVGTVPFNHRNGDNVSFNVSHGTVGTHRIDYIEVLTMMLTPGISDESDSGINLTSKAAWKMLNRRFRGVSKYQQSDFGIIQFGIVDFFASLAEAERIYGVLQHYSLNNKQVPNGLALSMGFDPESFADLADYRLQLNKLILSAKTLCLVKGYALLDHALLLLSNVFKDKDTNRAQLFMFRKPGYWLYDPTNANGSSLTFVKYSTTTKMVDSSNSTICHLRKSSDVIADLKYQLSALLNDDDVDNVCSDILAFYGNKEEPAEIVSLTLMPEDYEIQPIFSDSICRQVHNTVPFGAYKGYKTPGYVGVSALDTYYSSLPTAWSSYNVMVWQEDNVIKFNLEFADGTLRHYTVSGYGHTAGTATDVNAYADQPIIDTDILSPTPEDVFEMTRLVALGEYVDASTGGTTYEALNCTTCPSTLILGVHIWQFNALSYAYSASSGTGFDHVLQMNAAATLTEVQNVGGIYDVELLTRYDWSIICYMDNDNIIADLDNFRDITLPILKPIHEIAFISEFKNPITDLLIKED